MKNYVVDYCMIIGLFGAQVGFIMKDEDKTKEQLIDELVALRNELDKSKIHKYVLDQLPVCTIVYDKSEKVIYRNKATKLIDGYDDELLGLTRKEYLKRLEIDPIKILKRNCSLKDSFTEGIFGLTETTLRTIEGALKNVLLVGNFIHDDKDTLIGACGCALDMSGFIYKQIQSQKQLLKSEERYHILFNNANDAIFVYGLTEDNLPSKFLEVNDIACQRMGYSRDELLSMTPVDIYPKEHPEKVYEIIRDIFMQGYITCEMIHITKNGLKVPVEISSHAFNLGDQKVILTIARDITERKQIEAELRTSEERFYKAFHHSPNIMFITTIEEGRFIDVNDAFLLSSGYKREEVIDSTSIGLNTWAKPEDRERVIKKFIDKGSIHNEEIYFRPRHGNIHMGLFSAEFITINGEKLLLGVMNDITEHKKMEREMTRLDRLNLIGEMAAGIAHEIRNPMTTVRGYLQMLGGRQKYADLKEYFDLMIEELDRANLIITDYLTLARNKPVDLKMQNLSSIIESVFPLIQADAMMTDINIHMELNDIPDFLMDEKEIIQILLNFIRNGIDVTPSGKYLTIKTYVDGSEVVLSVKDCGNEIPSDILDKIGTPFFTTKESGTGLGLATCYSIANRHNAIIKIETGPEGTTFYVKFKVSE